MNNVPLILVAPDFSHLDAFTGRREPPVLWPVGSQSLAGLWLDHAVRLGRKRVVIHAVDRPVEIRAALAGGAFWSVHVEVLAQAAPAGAIPMLNLPGEASLALPTTAAELLNWWFQLNVRWLASRDPDAIAIDRCPQRDGWIAPGVAVHPTATLIPPFWIGTGTTIGPGCQVGPNGLIGPGCLLDEDVRVENSLVLGQTYLGRHLEVSGKIVDGGSLMVRSTGACLDLQDDLIASRLAPTATRVSWSERLTALLLWLPGTLLALRAGPAIRKPLRLPDGHRVTMVTRSRGSLLARRSGWLVHVMRGRMHLIGILPRMSPSGLPRDSQRLLDEAVPGAFSLADLHGIHSTADAEEGVHAAFQAAVPAANATVWRNLFRLCLLRPPGSSA